MSDQFNLEYEALTHGAALQLRPDAGILRLHGEDRVDFLQRMTSNDIKRLRPGQSCVTVLTSPTARVLFVFTVLCQENELWLLPARNETTSLERHLRGNIFFMDKVTVRNLSADWQRGRLMGVTLDSMLPLLGFEKGFADQEWRAIDGFLLVRQDQYDVPGYEVLMAATQAEILLRRLADAGVITLADMDAYHVRRVELGRPTPGAELTSEYSPLEAGLAWACAENKGCYTGQEIIARQITYDKVTKTLVRLSSPQPLAVGATILADGKEVGTVTSTAAEHSTANALAIVKRPYNTAGNQFSVDGIAANVV
ncbi:MAG: hypothetical protein U0175_29960 [Caldilineaceae bacterium]